MAEYLKSTYRLIEAKRLTIEIHLDFHLLLPSSRMKQWNCQPSLFASNSNPKEIGNVQCSSNMQSPDLSKVISCRLETWALQHSDVSNSVLIFIVKKFAFLSFCRSENSVSPQLWMNNNHRLSFVLLLFCFCFRENQIEIVMHAEWIDWWYFFGLQTKRKYFCSVLGLYSI